MFCHFILFIPFINLLSNYLYIEYVRIIIVVIS